jgi:hypothetical protein
MALSIQNIKKYTFYTSLRARVCRVWIPKLNGQTSSFNCLFADNMVSSSFALLVFIAIFQFSLLF